jgi:methyl-accepting chemotaxis protein
MSTGGASTADSTEESGKNKSMQGGEGSSPDGVTHPSQLSKGWLGRQLWRIRHRRKFLVNRRQFRTTILIVGFVLLLLIVVNLALLALRSTDTGETTPSFPVLREVMQETDRDEMLMIILASVVVLAGVFVVTIIETHRTAGAAFAVGRQLSRVADGHLDVELALRRGDNLRELEGPFNEMIDSLKNQATEDVATLERLADDIEAASDTDISSNAATELRELAARKRHLLE